MNNSASDWCWPSLGGTLQVGGGGYLDTSRVWIRLPQVWQLQEQWNSFIFALNINCHFMKKAKCLVKLEAYATAVGCFGAHWPLSLWWVTTHNPGSGEVLHLGYNSLPSPDFFRYRFLKQPK